MKHAHAKAAAVLMQRDTSEERRDAKALAQEKEAELEAAELEAAVLALWEGDSTLGDTIPFGAKVGAKIRAEQAAYEEDGEQDGEQDGHFENAAPPAAYADWNALGPDGNTIGETGTIVTEANVEGDQVSAGIEGLGWDEESTVIDRPDDEEDPPG